MMRMLLPLLTLSLVSIGSLARSAEPAKPVDFDRQIRPILAEHCIGCHGGSEPKAGLKLTSRAEALAATESGAPAIVPGKPGDSPLLHRITAKDSAERMPPEEKKPLQPDEIEKLRQWIAEGAQWSDHWSFTPIQNPAPPAVRAADRVLRPIDRFILSKLEAEGLSLSPIADKATLIKRLCYDLLGLPPKPELAAVFIKDDRPDAYRRLVDELLDSPHFGERWGRHWLDLAHYADSDGFEKDRARPDAYLFRDWVIEAINRDLPYDQFTIEQLAGDLLPNATSKQKLATAFLRQTLTNEEGGVDQEEYRVSACFDRTETVGTVWLGLTIGCCRCHSHKYDPLPHADYYRFFSFFNNADEVAEPLPITADRMEELETRCRPIEAAIARRRQELAASEKDWADRLHQRILATPITSQEESPLTITRVESTVPAARRQISTNEFVIGAGDELVPDVDVCVVHGHAAAVEMTGLKLTFQTHDALPKKGPGLSESGNFVLSELQLSIDDEAVALQRPTASYAQKGFAADGVLDGNVKTGWAVGGRDKETVTLTLRTTRPVTVPANATVKVVLEQQHGAKHLIGRCRLSLLTGNARGLEVPTVEIAGLLEMYPEKRVAKTKEKIFDYYVEQIRKDEQWLTLQKELVAVRKEHQAKLMEARMIGAPTTPRVTRIFHRGEFLSPTEPVSAGTPTVVGAFKPRSAAAADRLDLARWLVEPANPLTARVAVNQIWSHLFGAGIVRSANDFGIRGERPTHPELLDWLAHQFKSELRWSRKALLREILLSATYRQASQHRAELAAKDPTNALLGRQNRMRVEAEVIRDLNLAVAGLLSPKVGGPSVFPPMPEELAKLSYANNFTWKNSTGDDRYRRGMYTFFKRTIPHPNLMMFDCPDANVTCVARSVSNTPLQALTMLNNESHVEASQALAKRVLEQADALQPVADGPASRQKDQARLATVVQWCLVRAAQPAELDLLQQLLTSSRAFYQAQEEDAKQIVGVYATPAASLAESAAWTATVRTVLNVDEFITRE